MISRQNLSYKPTKFVVYRDIKIFLYDDCFATQIATPAGSYFKSLARAVGYIDWLRGRAK